MDQNDDRHSAVWARSMLAVPILLIVLPLWTVIGFAIWAQKLVRLTLIISLRVLVSATTNTPQGVSSNLINEAVQFYSRGFRRIFDSVTIDPDTDERSEPLPDGWFGRGLAEVIYTLIMFGVPFFAFQIFGEPSSPRSSQGRSVTANQSAFMLDLTNITCASFYPCTRSEMIQVSDVVIRPPTRSQGKAGFEARICNAADYEKHVYLKQVFYVDNNGSAVSWSSFSWLDLLGRECVVVRDTTNDKGDWTATDFTNGTLSVEYDSHGTAYKVGGE